MEIDRVSATVKKSQEIKGVWVSAEVGAEATVGPREIWSSCQADLYEMLADNLRSLFVVPNGNGANESTAGAESQQRNQAAPVSPPPEQTREHWCAKHCQEWTEKTGKGGATFYSHRLENGWCNEPKAA